MQSAIDSEETFTLSEAMRRLGYHDETFIDRKQFVRLLELASERVDLDLDSRSRRYSTVEIAGAVHAIELLKSQWGFTGGKLECKTVTLAKACEKLRSFGIAFPLTQATIEWDLNVKRYVFYFDGFLVDAQTGQARIDNLLSQFALEESRSSIFDAAKIDFFVARRRPIGVRFFGNATQPSSSTQPSIPL